MAADREETPAVKVGQAVHFVFTDELFGTTVEQAGIVLAVGEGAISVAPVASQVLEVPAEKVSPLPDPAEGSS